jgi:hypothetical protein
VFRQSRLVVALSALLAIEYSLYFALVPSRPSAEERWSDPLPGGPFANVLGQRGYWQIAYGSILLFLIYAVKTILVYKCNDDSGALILYGICLLFCLPVLWVFVTTDCNNPFAELAYWSTPSVGLLLVPTLGLLRDLNLRPYVTVRHYTVKTAVELILIPVWYCAWIYIEFILGFYWI